MNRIVAWARQPGPERVLTEARDRLERGKAGAAALRVPLSGAERHQVGELLGLDWQGSGRPVTLPLLRKALDPYGIRLEMLLEDIAGPLVDRVADRAAVTAARADEARAARALLATAIDPGLVDQVAAACLPAREPLARAQELTRVAARLSAQLSRPAQVYLPTLAADCFDDPHALDRNRSLGQAAARMCLILAGQEASSGALLAEQWRLAWAGVGVSCDRVSTMVLALNLPLTGSHAVTSVTSVPGEPVWLTTRLLDQAGPPDPPLREVFVCENPSVLETAADRLGDRCAPLICTFGRPSQAAHLLVRLLAESGSHLRVRADNDSAGRSFVQSLLATAPAAEPWRFHLDSPAYEEQILGDLLADLALPEAASPEGTDAADSPLLGRDGAS